MGWGWVAVAVVAGCCPVVVDEPYPELADVVWAPGWQNPGGCSWGYVGPRLAVTALHCFTDYGVADHPAILGTTWDAALVAVDDGAELAPRMVAHADVGLFSVLCYYSFDGEPNCGRLLWQTDQWIVTTAETRLVRDGDSGSPLLTRDGELVGVVVQGDGSPGLMRAAKVPAGWMSRPDL